MLGGPSKADFVGVAGCEGGSAEVVGKRNALWRLSADFVAGAALCEP